VLRRLPTSPKALPEGCATASTDASSEGQADKISLKPSLLPFSFWPSRASHTVFLADQSCSRKRLDIVLKLTPPSKSQRGQATAECPSPPSGLSIFWRPSSNNSGVRVDIPSGLIIIHLSLVWIGLIMPWGGPRLGLTWDCSHSVGSRLGRAFLGRMLERLATLERSSLLLRISSVRLLRVGRRESTTLAKLSLPGGHREIT